MRNRNYPLVVLASLTLIATLGGCDTEVDNKPAASVGEAREVQTSTSEVTTVDVLEQESRIEWVGAKVTGQHDGGFREFDGSISFEGDTPRQVTFTIGMGSIWSDTERLTNHLKTPDFFDIENHPEARFESTSIVEKEGEDGSNYEISGNLELRGHTNSITFPASVDMTGDRIQTNAQFTIDRQLWNVSYKGAPDDLIRDDVLIKLDLVFLKPDAEGAVASNELEN